MQERIRHTGIDLVGDVPWGTHFCQFYQTPRDLLDILVPYFKAGLENNECCMWITSEPLGASEARESLQRAMPNLEDYLESGQLEILSHSEWYLKGGRFDSDEVLAGWLEKLEYATDSGYDGLRLSGNTFWLEKADWDDFTDYEAAIDTVIGRYHMLAICTYCLDKCSALEVLDVIKNHQFALIKRAGRWDTIESSDRRRLSEALLASEERYRRIVETATEGIWTINEGGEITVANSRLAEMLGCTVGELIGQPLSAVLREASTAVEQRINEPASRGLAEQVTLKIDRKDGKPLWAIMSTSPILDNGGRYAGALGVVADITHLHDLQEEREDLLRSVSHDLRNPLTSIHGHAQLLARMLGKDEQRDVRISKSIEAISISARQMGAMIDDLVDAERLESGQLQLRRMPVDLTARVAESLKRSAASLDVGRVRVEMPAELPMVEADPELLDRILTNLVSNALKYSAQTAPVLVRAESADREIRVSVADRGVGIAQEDLSHLFERYFRAKNAQDAEGLGLGLFVTKGLVEAHGGKIWVMSKPGQGSTFTFTLPRAAAC
jgi:PAS domain S-box-containing protein